MRLDIKLFFLKFELEVTFELHLTRSVADNRHTTHFKSKAFEYYILLHPIINEL